MFVQQEERDGGGCVLSYYDASFFGLSKTDSIELFGKSKSDWTPPTSNKIKCNARRIETIKETIIEEEEVRYRYRWMTAQQAHKLI